MWHLKFKYRHSDCIYAPKLKEFNLSVFFYHIGYYIRENYTYTSAIQQLVGGEKNIKKYIKYMKNHDNIVKVEVYGDTIFTLAKHKKDLDDYKTAYDPIFITYAPAYLSNDGYEIIEIACWEREPLQKLIKNLQKNKTTTHFEILQFNEKDADDIYISRLLPKLSKKQGDAIKLAFQNGYYEFPKKTSLDKLAKISRVSKPTFRENLRKAEAKLMPRLVSK